MQMDRRTKLTEVFEDTQRFYTENAALAAAIAKSKAGTKLYGPEEKMVIPASQDKAGSVFVTKSKTFEAAIKAHQRCPDKKITVLNFASATNPGGGVRTGSSAQEESLCRCSTLYPTLTQDWLWKAYYQKNRSARDNLHTDACIYSPGVIICKTDESFPVRMEEKDWLTVDVVSCAAPNLREHPGNRHNPEYERPTTLTAEALYNLHVKRGNRIVQVAAANGADILILGAFGCGAFANDPLVVARAYKAVMRENKGYFDEVEFAIYCRPGETMNYEAFKKTLSSS